MDEAIVSDYLGRLNVALGNDAEFRAIFDQMKRDTKVGQPEAVGIVSGFLSPVAKSTTKTKAFERIWARHANLRAHMVKERVTASRSAA